MKITFLIFLLIIILINACQNTETDKALNYLSDKVVLSLTDSTEIPFQYCEGMMMIEVEIDQKLAKFVLDPHRTTHLFSLDFIKKANLQTTKISAKFNIGHTEQIKIGKAIFKEVGVLIPQKIEEQILLSTCFSVVGVIGSNVMQMGAWQIDYQNQKITIKPNLPKQENTPYWVGKKDQAKRFSSLINLSGKREIIVRMGTSNKSTISLPAQIFHETRNTINYQNLEKYLVFDTENQATDTIYTVWMDSVYTYNLLFGKKMSWTDNQTWKKQKIDFTSRLKLKDGGTVNNGFWENHMVWWSSQQEIIYAKPKPYQEKYLHELIFLTYGFKLGMHNGKIIVVRLRENSIAEKAGLKLKDEILQIEANTFKQSQDFCQFIQIQQSCAKTMKVVTATKTIELAK